MLEKEAIRERIEFNKEFYSKLFTIINKPKKVLDLGCGLNPLYFPHKKIKYIAVDKNKKTLKQVKRYFKKNKINGEVICCDIKDVDFQNIKNIDLVLALKIFDSVEKIIVKKLLYLIHTKWLVVSFPTRTISGKRMNKPRRKWFESMVKIEKILRFHNEIFYIIKK